MHLSGKKKCLLVLLPYLGCAPEPALRNISETIASPARQVISLVGSDHHGVVDAAAAKDSYTKRRLDYSEKVWLCRLHNGNPEVYTVARLAKDYKCSMQLVEKILHE